MKEQQSLAVRPLDPVDFHGQSLVVINRGGEPFVAMRPIVKGMGLDWPSQYQKMIDNQERWGVVMIPTPSQGGEQTTISIPLRKLPGWLMGLQPNRMNEDVSAKIVVYQNECDDALWAYWSQGVAVNPRAVSADPTAMGLPDFRDPGESARAWLTQYDRAKAAEQQAKQLAAKVEADEPSVAFAEQFKASKDCILVGELAKVLSAFLKRDITRKALFELLFARHLVMRAHDDAIIPTQRGVIYGWLRLREGTRRDPDGSLRLTKTTMVTAKGQVYVYNLLRQAADPRVTAAALCAEVLPD